MRPKLILVAGKADKAEIRLKLPTIVGRTREAGLMIAHKTVSRRHCELFERHGMLFVRDTGSRNGTMVDSAIVKEAMLKPGHTLTVGPLTFRADYEPADSFIRGEDSDNGDATMPGASGAAAAVGATGVAAGTMFPGAADHDLEFEELVSEDAPALDLPTELPADDDLTLDVRTAEPAQGSSKPAAKAPATTDDEFTPDDDLEVSFDLDDGEDADKPVEIAGDAEELIAFEAVDESPAAAKAQEDDALGTLESEDDLLAFDLDEPSLPSEAAAAAPAADDASDLGFELELGSETGGGKDADDDLGFTLEDLEESPASPAAPSAPAPVVSEDDEVLSFELEEPAEPEPPQAKAASKAPAAKTPAGKGPAAEEKNADEDPDMSSFLKELGL